MSQSRGHEHEQDRVFASRRSQLLKCFELAVDLQHGLRYLAIGEVPEVITRNPARCRSQRRDQSISVCPLGTASAIGTKSKSAGIRNTELSMKAITASQSSAAGLAAFSNVQS